MKIQEPTYVRRKDGIKHSPERSMSRERASSKEEKVQTGGYARPTESLQRAEWGIPRKTRTAAQEENSKRWKTEKGDNRTIPVWREVGNSHYYFRKAL